MSLEEYVVIKPMEVRDKRRRWHSLFWLVVSTFFHTIMPFIVGVYFAQNGSLFWLLFLLFPILFDIKRKK